MATTVPSNKIVSLVKRMGINPDYYDMSGQKHEADAAACIKLLKAMGLFRNLAEAEINREDVLYREIDHAFEELERQEWENVLPPVMVIRQTDFPIQIVLNLPDQRGCGHHPVIQWTLQEELGAHLSGEFHTSQGVVRDTRLLPDGSRAYRVAVPFPLSPPLGYHDLSLPDYNITMKLIVVPEKCYVPAALDKNELDARVWGPSIQLYSLRSDRNWGIGDYTDLLNMVDWCADQGAGVLGINPIHELFPHNPNHISPYSPSSRLFYNVFHIDVMAVPNFSDCGAIKRLVLAPEFQSKLKRLRETDTVDYLEVIAAKWPILEKLYQDFRERHLSKQTSLAEEYNHYVVQAGAALKQLALFEALQEHFYSKDKMIWGWMVWPESYRDPNSEDVRTFAVANRERVEFYQYLQWLADRQLAAVGWRSYERSLPVGLYMDIAVGVDRGGAEVWANQDLYAFDAGIGAPPDNFNQKGQNWGLPPMIPHKLRARAYAPISEVMRRKMKYAGALRIDHVMALFRLFWIPPDASPADGAYVCYPLQDLMGILALESHRNQCLVIGEDLGMVSQEVRDAMADWGVYSYKVFLFERMSEYEFTPPDAYPEDALVTLSTHDLPTLAGFWQGRDIQVRAELNQFPSEESREKQVADRVMERVGILKALERQNLLPEGVTIDPASTPSMTLELTKALHEYLARTPSKIQMFQLDDVFQQMEQMNLPGTTTEHPNWRRKLSRKIEDFSSVPELVEICNTLRAERSTVFF